MKKGLSIFVFCALLLLLSAALFMNPQTTSARASQPTDVPGVADGSWVWDDPARTGSETPVDLSKAPAPQWQDVMSWNALQIDGAARICHPFRGGQLGWVPTIRLFTGKSWEPLATVMEWVPDEEGQLMACAQALAGGTYALFGGYVRPAAVKDMPMCAGVEALAILEPVKGEGYHLWVSFAPSELVGPGMAVSYSFTSISPSGSLSGSLSGSGFVNPAYEVFFAEIIEVNDFDYQATVRLVINGCYIDVPVMRPV